MHAILPTCVALLVLSTFALRAQAGNETIFIGTSTSASPDNHAFVASGTGTIVSSGASSFTDNVTRAVWADSGRNLYCAQQGMHVSRAAWNGSTPTWSTFYSAPGSIDLGLDAARRRLWVLTWGALHCLDADPNSAGYGSLITQRTIPTFSRLALSRSGNLAAFADVVNLFQLIDTDPTSPTFLQTIVSMPIPGASQLASVCRPEISLDERYVYLCCRNASINAAELAVWDRLTATWLDFGSGAGQQHFVMQVMSQPNSMLVSLDRSFALVAGEGTVWRIFFDYANPANTTMPFPPLSLLPYPTLQSLSPDGTRALLTQTVYPGSSYWGIINAFSLAPLQGGLLGSNTWGNPTAALQDASPTATYAPFGAGCTGTLGVPTLAAQAGSRPALGSTFTAVAGGLPHGVAVLQAGLSNSLLGGVVPLPLPLAAIGMPGCNLLVDPLVSAALVGPGNSATWVFPVPSTQSLFGFQFFSQAFPFDPLANPFGFSASNGTIATLGF